MVYKIKTGLNQVSKSDTRYSSFDDAVKLKDAENEQIRMEQQKLIPSRRRPRRQKDPQPEDPEEDITGEGYQRGNISQNLIPCSRSVLDDVSRLEVLIGGKRAGNNSLEMLKSVIGYFKIM